MKTYKQYVIVALAGFVLIPQVTFAAWWNPFSWFRKTVPPVAIERSPALQSNTTAQATKPGATPAAKVTPKPTQSTPKATPTPTTYGSDILPYEELGWPNRVKSTVPITGKIESLPGMAVVRVIPTMNGATEFTLTISGFPANMDLHVYTEGYRVHNVIRTNAKGEMNFILPPARGYQYIILEKEA